MICRIDTLPDPPLPLLITGIAGVAGYNALRYFQRRYGSQVWGIRPVRNWPLKGSQIIACDVEDRDALRGVFRRHRFASVLNCAGSCALKSCELDPAMAWRVNVRGVRNLLDVLSEHPARLLHLSIDLVYSGTRGGGYVESEWADPVTVYGRTMAVAEQLVTLADPTACVLRISLPMGVSFNGHAGAIDWIQSRFKQRKPATLYYDEIRTPTYTDCLSRVCQAILGSDLRGLYHGGGPRRLSLYEIAQIVNRVGGYHPGHLQGCYRVEAGPVPPRAGNVAMDSNRLRRALGFAPFDPWPFSSDWVPTDRHWHYRRDETPSGSPELLARILYQNPGVELSRPE